MPRVSRFGLGTVQFGMAYGIGNRLGQVPYGEVLQILLAAREAGINFLDTARFYGSSEETIGRALEELRLQEHFLVCSKLDLPAGYPQLSDPQLLEAARSSLHRSLEALRLDRLPFYLLHTLDYKDFREGIVWRCVLEEQAKGAILHPGVSIARHPAEALAALQDGRVRAIQIPYNLFDARWHRAGVLEAAAGTGALVFSRSCYLQGLLLMPPEEAARKVPAALPYLRALEELAGEIGAPAKELALRYVFSTPGIASTVIGVDSPAQMRENLRLYRTARLPAGLVDSIRERFAAVPEQVVNPALWNVPYPPPDGRSATMGSR
jgi:aryl-alcohol dehydrogenase-like predicted oxidoreductase